MNPDISIKIGDTKFNYRAAAWLECEGRILLHKDEPCLNPEHDFWNIPGGRVKCGEDAYSAVVREIEEELGQKLNGGNIIKIMENFFTFDGQKAHEMLFIVRFVLPKTHPIAQRDNFRSLDNDELMYKWFKKSDIKSIVCKPVIIYELAQLDTYVLEYKTGK